MREMFIRIGGRYIAVAHIIEIYTDGELVQVTTSELVPEGVGESDWAETSNVISYRSGTPEATALLAWADQRSQVLI